MITETILGELNALWARTGLESASRGGVLRACTMTLIIVTDQGEDFQALGETVAALMPEHPARTIMVNLKGESEAVGHRVYAQCWMPFGQRRQICCEQIEITSADPAPSHLAPLISPLAAPDLPIVLWLRRPSLFFAPGLSDMTFGATKVIVDSLRFPDTAAALRSMLSRPREHPIFADLSWTRITRWRETLSRIFENRENLARLSRIRSVRIFHGGERPPVFAWYMGAWVMNVLDDAGLHAELTLSPDPGLGTGTLRVELSGDEFEVALERQQDRLLVRAGGLSYCTNLSQPSDYVLMREELSYSSRDRVFERTLQTAAGLAAKAV